LRKGAKGKGFKVVIAGAGLSAALPGFAASLTDLPVIGVPFAVGALNGLDALLATVQVPPGVPVATVGVDNAKNAAHLAIRILRRP
jgi:phosphoribosylaminoimidazole carboxylase PurE protein